jgi:hypothetical protein
VPSDRLRGLSRKAVEAVRVGLQGLLDLVAAGPDCVGDLPRRLRWFLLQELLGLDGVVALKDAVVLGADQGLGCRALVGDEVVLGSGRTDPRAGRARRRSHRAGVWRPRYDVARMLHGHDRAS